MNLDGKKLDEWFLSLHESECSGKFPHEEFLPSKYKMISEQLFKWIHPEVGVGAGNADRDKGKSFLTNHGNDHIKTLINRASQFVDKTLFELSPFEIYMLLMAIHIHDVGNMLGRDDHEINSKLFVEKLKGTSIVGEDDLIWDYIYRIAKAHKGYQIAESLPGSDHLYDIPFRPQLLAAIVKFADELAENYSRGSKINAELANIPEESRLYHEYAFAINSIVPDPNAKEIVMIFNLNEAQLSQKFIKGSGKTYLVEEIYLRTLKTYSEKVYCMKFMRPEIDFDTIKVTINIARANSVLDQIPYELTETVIHDICMKEMHRMCPSLINKMGENLIIKDKQNASGKKNKKRNSSSKKKKKSSVAKRRKRNVVRRRK